MNCALSCLVVVLICSRRLTNLPHTVDAANMLVHDCFVNWLNDQCRIGEAGVKWWMEKHMKIEHVIKDMWGSAFRCRHVWVTFCFEARQALDLDLSSCLSHRIS